MYVEHPISRKVAQDLHEFGRLLDEMGYGNPADWSSNSARYNSEAFSMKGDGYEIGNGYLKVPALGLRVRWYKSAPRDMQSNVELTEELWATVRATVLQELNVTEAQLATRYAQEEEARRLFQERMDTDPAFADKINRRNARLANFGAIYGIGPATALRSGANA